MAYVALAHREIGVKNGFSKSKYMYIQIKAFHVKVQSCIYKGTNPPVHTLAKVKYMLAIIILLVYRAKYFF